MLLGVLFLPIAEALYRGQAQLGLTFLWGSRRFCGAAAAVAGPDSFSQSRALSAQLALFLLWERCARSGVLPGCCSDS